MVVWSSAIVGVPPLNLTSAMSKIIRVMPEQKFLQERFEYDPDTGYLIWKERPSHHFTHKGTANSVNSRLAGKKAGRMHWSGGLDVTITSQNWMVHRVIYKLMTGEEPSVDIIHIDGDPLNNRWSNLALRK